jgi:serine/threonine protein kinase
MEFVPGRTLEKIIQTAGRLSERDSLALIAQATDGLSCAHRGGIVHRDVKPANMVVTASGVLKITDFGITLIPQLALQGWGTAAYMAPEQLVGDTSDGRTDIYSLAIVLYELLCGSTPFVSVQPDSADRSGVPLVADRCGTASPGRGLRRRPQHDLGGDNNRPPQFDASDRSGVSKTLVFETTGRHLPTSPLSA